ncbi:MAG: hypothetical protein D6731_03975 [Planctomycetota bacterium]|nr:MAG: hypothetical protein D6731_03975 [Planctomycetota bacterium]
MSEQDRPRNEASESTETSAAEAGAEAAEGFLAHLKARGEAGKREWEGLLTKARETLEEHSQRLYRRALDRGAALLLRALSSVRQGAEALERSVAKARDDDAAPSEAQETPATA